MNNPSSSSPPPVAPASRRRATPLESLLNGEQTEALARYLEDRIQSVSAQMSADFLPRREIYARQMEDDFSWRRGSEGRRTNAFTGSDELAADIFDLQNDSLNIVGGFAAFMTARTADDLFGTDPFYALNPEGLEDRQLADDLQKHSEWKLRQSPFKDAALDAVDLAMGLGEGVLKVHWHREVDVYECEATVLHLDGEPVLTIAGEYLFPEDVLEPIEPSAGTGFLTAGKDPSLRLDPARVTWEERAIEKTNVSCNGVRAATMHYKDFLCPLTAEDVAESDFVGHRFQMGLTEAAQRFAMRAELVERLRSETSEAKAARDLPRMDEVAERQDGESDPVIEFVECWVKHDPVGDGRLRRIYALIALPIAEIVEMDYMANRTPGGQLPFFVVRAYKVKNRWYGRGYYETYASAQEYIDRQLNRIEYRNRFHSNPAVFVNHNLLAETEDAGDFELRPGRTFMKRSGARMQDIVEAWAYPDLDERTWQLMQFMIQTIQVRSGVTSAAQGEVSSLPSTATATGIESILQSASVLARLPMGNIRAGLEKALLYAVKLIYANFDRDEVFTYFEGDDQRARTLEAGRVQNLDLNVRLLLTRFKQRESLDSAQKAIDVHARYIGLPELEKGAARPLYVQALKGLGFDQADGIIRQQQEEPPAPAPGGLPEGGAAGAAMGGAAGAANPMEALAAALGQGGPGGGAAGAGMPGAEMQEALAQ